jgi:uncharacterized membrane protein
LAYIVLFGAFSMLRNSDLIRKRIQAGIDVANGLEWAVRRISVILLPLVGVSALLHFDKPGMLMQVLVSLLCLVGVNLGFTAIKWLLVSMRD